MDMAFLISQKSLDPSTKHGCIAIDVDHTPLSMGYNSPPRNCIDENIPLERNLKYPFFCHSEENCIINAARSGISLKGSIFYITGFPCSKCFRGILNVGAIKIVYGPVKSNCVSNEDRRAIEIMNQKYASCRELLSMGQSVVSYLPLRKVLIPRIEFVEYKGEVGKILSQTQDYIKEKCQIKV